MHPVPTRMEAELRSIPDLLASLHEPEVETGDVDLIAGSGSSFNAALIATAISGRRIPVVLPYEVRSRAPGVMIAMSQSGRSRSILEAARHAGRVIAVTNDPRSPLAERAERVIPIQAGPEVSIPATKSVALQVVLLSALLGKGIRGSAREGAAAGLLIPTFALTDDVIVLGDGETRGLARELALKLKETARIHAEMIDTFELRHGPVAMLDDRFAVLAVGSEDAEVHEAVTRTGATWHTLRSETVADRFSTLVFGFLLALHAGLARGCDVDAPLHLRKAVT